MAEQGLVAPITNSRTLRNVAIYSLLVGLYAVLPVLKEYSGFKDVADLPSGIHAALTLVLGWLLVFRTNTAYARWWEARTLWGGLVNASRNVAVKIASHDRIPAEEMELSEKLIVGFAPLLRDHLRNEEHPDLIDVLRTPGPPESCPLPASYKHPPSEFVRRMYLLLQYWKQDGRISEMEYRVIDEDLSLFLDICGGCERIRNTRIARSYRVFARQCVFLFLATFPWGISNEFHGWTIPLTVITAYFMLGLETVAEHVEEPFGYDEDDLDLDGLCRAIALSVREIYALRNEMPRYPLRVES